MPGFSIDDVRDTLTADITSFLVEIEQASQALLAAPGVTTTRLEDDHGRPLFDVIGDLAHSITGTTALVDANSLADSARLLEKLAATGKLAWDETQAQLIRVRKIVEACVEGAAEMRSMLKLELDHLGDDAQWVAIGWMERTTEAVGPLRDPAPHGPDSNMIEPLNAEITVTRSISPESTAARERSELDPELWEVFEQEARESLEELNKHLRVFSEVPDDKTSASAIERIFHSMKGASSTLGLSQVSVLAAELQSQMEAIVEGGKPATPELVREIISGTNQLLRTAGLPELAFWQTLDVEGVEEVEGVDAAEEMFAAPPRPKDASGTASIVSNVMVSAHDEFSFDDADEAINAVGDEIREIFKQEARESMVALQGHLQSLFAHPDSVMTMGHLERIYHTLKGASATVGLTEVSEAATDLQERMEAAGETGTPLDAEGLAKLLTDTNRLLEMATLPPIQISLHKSKAGERAVAGEAKSYFDSEARDILTETRGLIAELKSASADRAKAALADLSRLYHQLKGSSLLVQEKQLAEAASELHKLCEGGDLDSELLRTIEQRHDALLLLIPEAPPPQMRSAAPPREKTGRENTEKRERERGREPREKKVALTKEAVQIVPEKELWEAFVQECSELLDSLDRTILGLEESNQPKQSLELIFRLTHTLKGAVNTIGLGPTGKYLHSVEDFLEALVDAPILPAMKGVATLLLDVQADIRRHLREAPKGYVQVAHGQLESRIAGVMHGRKLAHEPATSGGSSLSRRDSASIARAHAASVASRRSAESARSDASGGGSADLHADGMDRRFIRVSTERLDTLMNLAGELVVSRSRLMTRVGAIQILQDELNKSRRRLTETMDIFRDDHEFSIDRVTQRRAGEQRARQVARQPVRTANGEAFSQFGELELDRYDEVNVLARRLGELTSDFNEFFGQMSREMGSFSDDSEAFGSIVSGIQSEVTRARMVPLEFLFSRLRLPVRDAAAREAKDVRVATRGEDVNLDKTMADALFQPMLHLVRNAVVHGIEHGEVRAGAGKPRGGTVYLSARQESGQILIEVRDDGAGLDLQRLHSIGVSMNLISPETPIDDPRVRELIYVTGLSTKAKAGAVAGRGVGMDVVKRTIERMNGAIRIESTRGSGTAFIITLPLTLAITRALIVRHGTRSFAIPLYFAERILDIEEGGILESAGVRRVRLDDGFMVVHRADHVLGTPGARDRQEGPIVIFRMGDARTAMQVDQVIGQEEIVVKSLGDLLLGHPLFAGVTIRGNGELVLIIDVPGLLAKTGHDHRPDTALDTTHALGARPVRALEQGTKRGPELPAKETQEHKLRVLVVDDSLSVRKVAERNLENLGVDVSLAVDGLDGLSKLREEKFDLVFTDLEMPRMHGYDLIRELRFLPAYADMPIIVVSSRSGQKHQDQARALGATDYITKPFTAQTLEAALRRWGQKRGEAGEKARTPSASEERIAPPESSEAGDPTPKGSSDLS